jgi:hypothetical protein
MRGTLFENDSIVLSDVEYRLLGDQTDTIDVSGLNVTSTIPAMSEPPDVLLLGISEETLSSLYRRKLVFLLADGNRLRCELRPGCVLHGLGFLAAS